MITIELVLSTGARKKDLALLYGVTYKTMRSWLSVIEADIGIYTGKRYTPAQVQLIVERLGLPKVK